MTEINNPFSQFNVPYAPMHEPNDAPVQNNVTSKEQTAQSNKKQFNYRDLLIPVGAASVGGIGGFTVAQFNKYKNNNAAEVQIEEHKTVLLQKFNENSDIKTIKDSLQKTNTTLKTIKENSIDYIEKTLPNEKSPKKIASLKESLEKAKKAKEYQEAALNKLNADLKAKYTNLVEEPLKEFTDNLKSRTAQLNRTFTKRAVAISILIGSIIGGIIAFCIKIKEKKINENNNNNTTF